MGMLRCCVMSSHESTQVFSLLSGDGAARCSACGCLASTARRRASRRSPSTKRAQARSRSGTAAPWAAVLSAVPRARRSVAAPAAPSRHGWRCRARCDACGARDPSRRGCACLASSAHRMARCRSRHTTPKHPPDRCGTSLPPRAHAARLRLAALAAAQAAAPTLPWSAPWGSSRLSCPRPSRRRAVLAAAAQHPCDQMRQPRHRRERNRQACRALLRWTERPLAGTAAAAGQRARRPEWWRSPGTYVVRRVFAEKRRVGALNARDAY